MSDRVRRKKTATPRRRTNESATADPESLARKKIQPLWQTGALFHNSNRYPRRGPQIDRLEADGLIARDRPAQNRRVVHVSITAHGLTRLRELDGEVRACHQRQLGHLRRSELRALTGLLNAARRPHERPDSHWAS